MLTIVAFCTLLFCVLLAASVCGLASPSRGAPSGGTPLLGPDTLGAFRLDGAEQDKGKLEVVPVEGQPFAKALRLTTKEKSANIFTLQLAANNTTAVAEGDVILAEFYLRCVKPTAETGEGETEILVEQNQMPYTKILAMPLAATRTWTKFSFPAAAPKNYPPADVHVVFRMGYAPQVIEVGGLRFTNYGKTFKVQDLPTVYPTFSYEGRDPDAPWRQAAAERIDRIRKADLTVEVTTQDGRPVGGAEVSVEMRRHAFGFGSAVDARWLTDEKSEDARRYREIVQRGFSKVVMENDLKWSRWENPENRKITLKAIQWLRNNGIVVRGHCLVWPGWRNLPRDLLTLKDNPAALRKRLNDHVTEEVSAMRGRLVDWDVINEPRDNHDLMDVLGNACMVEWFKLARQADPEVNLFINDYSILSGGGYDTLQQDRYEKVIRYLVEQGAPLDGIGMQGHFGCQVTSPNRLLEIVDRFAAFGKTIQITEFDVDVFEEQFQADFLRDFMTTLFSHPAVNSIVMWGFWEGCHWKPNAALFRKDWSIKPNGQAWMDLVLKAWWTRTRGRTDAQGRYRVRGFLGDYDIRAQAGTRVSELHTSLPKEGRTVKMIAG
ncbi:MAG TPA: endo-1,4-beta-xylanase [Phycisphaerae bacterium]|nr:endo-1,4-beta-xylanase [Phycisphaerae bacterium]